MRFKLHRLSKNVYGDQCIINTPSMQKKLSSRVYGQRGEPCVMEKRVRFKPVLVSSTSRGQCLSATLASRSRLLNSSLMFGLSCSIKATSGENLSVMPIKPESIKRYYRILKNISRQCLVIWNFSRSGTF